MIASRTPRPRPRGFLFARALWQKPRPLANIRLRMDFFLVTLGSHGDVHPFVGLGATLRARGHRVSIAASEHFGPLIEKAGLELISLGTDEEYRKLAGNPDLWKPSGGFHVVMESVKVLLPRVYEIVVKRVVPGETVVVASSLAMS